MPPLFFSFFFFNDTATTEIYTLSLHDALPISRVTAFGLYLEGVRDAARFARAAERARAAGKPIALIKAGRTEAATRTVRTHTGALAGADAAFGALCAQRSEEHTSELQSPCNLVCRLLPA